MTTPDSISAKTRMPVVSICGRHTPLDYLFFTRPVLMPPVWTIALLGTAVSAHPGTTATRWLLFMLQLYCMAGGTYTLNQIADVESDRRNRKLFFLAEGLIAMRSAVVFTVALHSAAIVLGACLGLEYLLLTIILLALGVAYSAIGPDSLKNRPILGLLANAIGHGMLMFMLGSALNKSLTRDSALAAIPYALAVAAVYLATTVPDRDGDAASGKRTLAVWLGDRIAMIGASLCVSATVVLTLLRTDDHLLIPSIVVLPLFAAAIWRPATFSARAAVASVVLLSIAASLAYPWYAPVVVAVIIGTRAFFMWRFRMTYPTFLPGR